MILAERAARLSAEAQARAESTNADAMIAHLRLEIEKLRRALYGVRSERKARLLEQMELQLEELETARRKMSFWPRKPPPGRAARRSAQASLAQTVSRASAARARGDPSAGMLSVLRIDEAVEAGRRRHRDAGGCSTPLEGHPDGAREVLLSSLRDHRAAASAIPCDPSRFCWAQPSGHDPVREVRPASAS